MTLAVDWPVNCARFATPLRQSQQILRGGHKSGRLPDGTDGECEASSRSEVRREDPVLSVVERTVSDGREDLANDEERIAIQVVRRGARHDDRAGQVEGGEDNGHDGATQFVDVEAEADAQESIYEVRYRNLDAETLSEMD